MRLLATFAVLCLGGVALLVTSPPAAKPVPRPIVRVAIVHRTVTKRLPRRTRIKRVVVNVPAPAPVAAPVVRPAVYHPAAAPAAAPVAQAPVTYRKPATAMPTNAGSLHQWEETHHRDAPNHDQLEHQGGDD